MGQKHAVDALTRLLATDDRPHLFLFVGPSGTGKTTLARILANVLGCQKPFELDAATNSGVDDMRSITEHVAYQSLDGGAKVVILDEVHAFSKAAWQASLKTMEEPPGHVYFVLCTTDSDKVPATVKTRATTLSLKSVGVTELTSYAEKVCADESISLPDGGIRHIVANSNGSVRQLLVDLALCGGLDSIPGIQAALEQASSDDHLIALARMLVSNRRSYDRCRKMLATLRETHEPESVRIGLVEYATSVFLNSDKTQPSLVPLLDLLSQPVSPRGGWASLCAALFAILGET